jgi:hypothetical protein
MNCTAALGAGGNKRLEQHYQTGTPKLKMTPWTGHAGRNRQDARPHVPAKNTSRRG